MSKTHLLAVGWGGGAPVNCLLATIKHKWNNTEGDHNNHAGGNTVAVVQQKLYSHALRVV